MVRCPFEVKSHYTEGFKADMPDDEWLHIVGAKKWIVCSHDAKWQNELAPLKAIEQHKIGCFYLWGASSQGFFKLKSLAHNYDKIKKICDEQRRPFIYKVLPSNRIKKIL
jgi:hypothetical protein